MSLIVRMCPQTNHFDSNELSNLIEYITKDTNFTGWPSLIYVLIGNKVSDDVVEMFIKYVLKRNKELCDIKDNIHYNDMFNEYIYQFDRKIKSHDDFDLIANNYPKSFKLLSEELYFKTPMISHSTEILIRLLKHFNKKINKQQIDNNIKQLKLLKEFRATSMQYVMFSNILYENVIDQEDLTYFFNGCLKHKVPIKISVIDLMIKHGTIDRQYIDALQRFRAKLILNNSDYS